jgi:hypothetical protein
MAGHFVLTYYDDDNAITTFECDAVAKGDPAHGHDTHVATHRGAASEADTIVTITAEQFIGFGWEQSG